MKDDLQILRKLDTMILGSLEEQKKGVVLTNKRSDKNDTKSEEVQEKRYRHFMILLYKDTTSYSYDDVLFDLKGNFKDYAYIEHQPEKEESKEHVHFILSIENGRSLKEMSNRLGVPINFIQAIKGLRASCRYLIHLDSEDKIKYDLTDVVVSKSFSRKFYGAFDDLKSEEDMIDDIYLYIETLDNQEYKDAIKLLVKYVNSQAYDTIYKRYRPEFQDYLKGIIYK